MLSGLLSFLSGSVFRMVWGEIAALLEGAQARKQLRLDHEHEVERMRLQGELDAAAHARNLEAQRLQAELNIQVVRVKSDADLALADAATFGKGVEATQQSTGIKWIDAWNASIRAALATECMLLIGLYYYRLDWKLDDKGWELAGAALGIFVADRVLFRRGK